MRKSATLLITALMAVGVLSAQVPPPQQTPGPGAAPTIGKALLAGQVIDQATSKPVAGAVVTLGGLPTPSGSNVIFNFTQATIPGGNRQVLTNNEGHFIFNDLPAGVYSIQSIASGYVPGGYGKQRATAPAQPINLGAEDRIIDLSVRLSRYGTISGRVIDEAGEPIVGVTVLAMRRLFDNGRPQYSTATNGLASTTDDRGEYRLSTLVPAEYILSIRSTQATVPTEVVASYMQALFDGRTSEFSREMSASGISSLGPSSTGREVGDQFFSSQSIGNGRALPAPPIAASGTMFVYPSTFYPSATAPADATIIPIRSGESRVGMDFHLRPVPASRVSGIATGPGGPVPRLGLSLVPATADLSSNSFNETATTVTDSRGSFVFLGVPAGSYLLRSMRVPPQPVQSEYTTVVQTGSGTTYIGGGRPSLIIPDEPSLWVSMPVTVGRDVTGLSVSLQHGFRISGRIEFEGSAARPSPDAIVQQVARVEAADQRSPLNSNLSADRVAFDAEGRLKSYELPAGRYFVTAGPFPNWTFKGAMLEGRDVSSVPLDLTRGDVANVVLLYTDTPSALSGTVRSAKGIGDVSAQVLLFPADVISESFVGSMRRFRSTRVANTGAYRFTSVAPGDYGAIAIDADTGTDFPSFSYLRSIAKQATRITVGDRENKTLDLATAVVR